MMDRNNMIEISMNFEQFKAYNLLLSMVSMTELPKDRTDHIFNCGFVSNSYMKMEDIKTAASILDNSSPGPMVIKATREQGSHLIELLEGIKESLRLFGSEEGGDFEIFITERAYNFLFDLSQ